jgi:hypothetical protein
LLHLQDSKPNAETALPPELPCYRCGYDLRAHPHDGICPECGGSVAESRQWAAIPRRPAWKNSDPRWRRRILAGLWVLVLLPLVDLLRTADWPSRVVMPTFRKYGSFTLDETLLFTWNVYPSIVFCMGVVLLFSKERGRRASRLDWTRRWGILCTYVVALLSTTFMLFVPALVMVGISALFLSMPFKNQPGVTRLFVELSTRYLRYAPYPKTITHCVLVTFSSITILLACVPLWEALCSTGLKTSARIILAPLAAFSLLNIAQTASVILGYQPPSPRDPFNLLGPYFRPAIFVQYSWTTFEFWGECVKWGLIFALALWLTLAQLAARRKAKPNRNEKKETSRNATA